MRKCFRRPISQVGCLLLVALAASTAVRGHGTLCKLIVVDAPTAFVDAACNSCREAEGTILLRNDNSHPVELRLSIRGLTSLDGKTEISSQPELFQIDPENRTSISEVQPGAFVQLNVRFTGLTEEGEWIAHLKNSGTEIGTLKVVNRHYPFSVALALPNSVKPDLTTTINERLVVPVTNSDSIAYSSQWYLQLSGVNEQLAKLDVIPGIFAVFLLGFSSDQVKNLLNH